MQAEAAPLIKEPIVLTTTHTCGLKHVDSVTDSPDSAEGGLLI